MKKKKIFWYLVFTSILGAKYCDEVPFWPASGGLLAEVRPDCISWRKKNKKQGVPIKRKCQPLYLSFQTTHTHTLCVLFTLSVALCAGLFYKGKSDSIYPHLEEENIWSFINYFAVWDSCMFFVFFVCVWGRVFISIISIALFGYFSLNCFAFGNISFSILISAALCGTSESIKVLKRWILCKPMIITKRVNIPSLFYSISFFHLLTLRLCHKTTRDWWKPCFIFNPPIF